MNAKSRGLGLIAFMAAVGLNLAASSWAATIVVPVKAQARITDEGGQTRILVDVGDLSALSGQKVLYAKLRMKVDVDTCTDALNEVEIIPVTTAWSPTSVTWDSPWDSAGGDMAKGYTRTVGFGTADDGVTEVLLTDVVQAWADGQLANFGLELIPRVPGCGYMLVDGAAQSAARYGELIIRYVKPTSSTGGG